MFIFSAITKVVFSSFFRQQLPKTYAFEYGQVSRLAPFDLLDQWPQTTTIGELNR
jgi:hypothetical protein